MDKEKKMPGTKAIRKYWREVFQRAFTPVWSDVGMRTLIILLALALFVWFISGIGFLFGLIPYSFVADRFTEINYGIASILGSLSLFAILFLAALWRTPAEMHYNQQKVIESFPPNQLNIFVGLAPGLNFNRWYIKDDVVIHIACLTVISHEKKKIVEFHATRLELLQRTSDMKPDIRGSLFGTVEKNLRFAWKNGEIFTELIPGDQDELVLAELNPKDGYPVFGRSKISSHEGKKPSIYEVYIQLKGKREGEMDFAYYNYRTEIYCHPENNILDFVEDSIDIPDDLKPKIFFANKEQEDQ